MLHPQHVSSNQSNKNDNPTHSGENTTSTVEVIKDLQTCSHLQELYFHQQEIQEKDITVLRHCLIDEWTLGSRVQEHHSNERFTPKMMPEWQNKHLVEYHLNFKPDEHKQTQKTKWTACLSACYIITSITTCPGNRSAATRFLIMHTW